MIKDYLSKRPLLLDRIEKYLLIVVFSIFAARMIHGYQLTGSPVTLIYLFDQTIVILFILLRRETNAISARIDDWMVGLAGTFLALLFGPTSGNPVVTPMVSTGFLIVGFAVHLTAKLTLRRSFGVVAANRGVKASGIYRVVRHPMYTGYMISQAGLLLSGPTMNNAIVLCACWALFLGRIRAEERILGNDPAYSALARYKLLPGIY